MYAKPIVLTRAVTAAFGAILAVASPSAGAAKPGGSDPCAAASDFPAFAYLSPVQRTRAVTLADTTGKCIRVLGNANTYLAPVLSYPISGTEDTGRVVWHEAETIYAIDFTVALPDNVVTITVPKRPVAYAGCCTLDLSKDGKTLYFSDSEASLSAVDLDTGAVVWSLPAPAPADPRFSHFINMSVNGDGSGVFATKMYVGADGGPDRSELVRVDVPGNATTVLRSSSMPRNHNYQAEASKDSDNIAFVEYVAGSNNCTPLVVADSNGRALFPALETSKRYGTFPAWSGSNVLLIRRSPPDGSGKCTNSDYITSVEPATGVETVLLKGWYPDGR